MKRFVVLGIICSVFAGFSADSAAPRGRVTRPGATGGTQTQKAAPVVNNAAGQVKAAPTTSARAAVNRGKTTVKSNTVKQAAAGAAPQKQISARAATTQKVINSGTKISGATANTVVDEECRTKYYGCMDSFCMVDNTNGGRCQCSNRGAELDKVLEDIQKLDEQSYAMATEGVERINMGDSADEVNAMANKVTNSMQNKEKEEAKKKTRSLDLSVWDSISLDVDEEENLFSQYGLDSKTGDALQAAVHEMCSSQMQECSSSLSMLRLMYAQQIKSDCSAYENSLKQQKAASAKKLQTAQAAMREAALEQYQNQNKYDLGQCTIRFKECMQTTAGCGDDFSKCASIMAIDNSQTTSGKKNKSKDYTVKTGATSITIAASTYDTLSAKKVMCESVTKQCVKVKDKVWESFLREAAPEIKAAEMIAESNVRMNCIGNISECFQKACKDNIDPNDPDGSYDMCLTRPETMLNVCKIQLNTCGIDTTAASKAEKSQIWGFVKARLASMRVDSCTKEVKACLQSDDRCGSDYSKCIGLDLTDIRGLCPLEKLVGCQKDGQDAAWDAIDNIVQGVYMDIDNSLLNSCVNIVNAKYTEICGDGETCSAFDNDELMGADSLTKQKRTNDGKFVIEGLTNFGKLKIKEVESKSDDIKFGQYELDIDDYAEKIKNVDGSDAVKTRVLATLQSTQNKINQKIAMLTSDPKVSMCVNGRDMKQISGREEKSTARFPHLLDSAIMAIINAGVEKASTNYAKKYDEMLTEVMEEQSDEIKYAMCAAMASNATSVNFNTSLFGTKRKADLFSDLYGGSNEVRMVIDGMKMNNLLQSTKAGKSTYVQTDGQGNMVSQIIMSSLYSASDNTCKVTITTQVCESMKDVYNTETRSSSSSCGSGGIFSWGCNGGSFSLIGGGGSTSSSYYSKSEFKGTFCQKMMAPTTKTEDIKM